MKFLYVLWRVFPFNSSPEIRKQFSLITNAVLTHTKNNSPVRRFFSEQTHQSRGTWQNIRSNLIKHQIPVGSALLGISVGAIYGVFNYEKKDEERITDKLTIALKNSEITHSRSNQFIPCPKIQEQINDALTYTFLDAGKYTVVYGSAGIGKTELVDHTAIGKKAVVKVDISSECTRAQVLQRLADELLGFGTHADVYHKDFIKAVKKSGIIPTLIFDIDPVRSHDDVLNAVRSVCKSLAPFCRCIMVVSEVNVLHLGRDPREKFIYVGEMERDEAKQLFKKLRVNITDAEMDYVFTNIGTEPLNMLQIASDVSETYSLQDYVADRISRAESQLVAFRHQRILKALKEHPGGVDPAYFRNYNDDGVDLSNPAAVGNTMKSSHAILYQMKQFKYVLISTAHRTALQSYEPIIRE